MSVVMVEREVEREQDVERERDWDRQPWASPEPGGWTTEDLDQLPDDGLRYELYDGVLLVSPAPILLHQRVVVRLVTLLDPICPPDLEVFVAPTDYRPTARRSFQPDVLIARCDDRGPK